MRIKLIACEVLFREICLCASRARSVIELAFLRRGLHSNPDSLRQQVQALIDDASGESAPSWGGRSPGFALLPEEARCQAVALGYGLCSNGVAGLRARDIPLVVPRAHDCITFLLGSKEKYSRLFSQRPGTYYYSGGWIERLLDRVPRSPEDGAGLDVPFEELVAKYGLDNAQYLWEVQSGWVKRYTHATHICMQLGDEESYREYVLRVAAEHGWEYGEVEGDLSLLQALCDGDWDNERFLIVPPGHQVVATAGADVIAARSVEP